MRRPSAFSAPAQIRTAVRFARLASAPDDKIDGQVDGTGRTPFAGNRIPNYRETQNYVKTVMQLYAMLRPPSMTASGRRTPGRVRMEMPVGGAIGRGNLPAGTAPRGPLAAAAPGEAKTERE